MEAVIDTWRRLQSSDLAAFLAVDAAIEAALERKQNLQAMQSLVLKALSFLERKRR